MTALNQYQRLEASALWRPAPDEQRREVIVSVGDATLIISDMQDRALTHWSIPAVERANPGKVPAVFHPDGDPNETLELAENETEMVEAIETLRRAIHAGRPRPGRLRGLGLLLSVASVAAAAVFWLPGALQNHVTGVVPDINRVVIGQDALAELQRLSGPPCREPSADAALKKLANRIGVADLLVVPAGIKTSAALPGGTILLNRSVLEDHEDPAVPAGFAVAEAMRADLQDPLGHMLELGGVSASFRLLTTGQVTVETLRGYAEALTTEDKTAIDPQNLIVAFAAADIPATPYAYAVDITGESTLNLIEADALITDRAPVLTDGEWVALQEICNN